MKGKDLREMTSEELAAQESTLRETLFKLSFQHGVRQLENTGKLRKLRKDIARVKTVMQEKQA